MRFKTNLPYKDPSHEHYGAGKGFTAIQKQVATSLPNTEYDSVWNPLAELVGEQRFRHFVRPRLELARRGIRQGEHLAAFPGTQVPALGNHGVTSNLGSLAIDRFLTTADMFGGVCDRSSGDRWHIEDAPMVELWPWSVPQPQLRTITPAANRSYYPRAAKEFLRVLEGGRYNNPLSVIQRAWCRHGHYSLTAMYQRVGKKLQKEVCSSPTFLFELEDVLSRAKWTNTLEWVGAGVYAGCWLEVYLCPIQRIRNQELAVTERVLQELETLVTDGYAPLVMNEYSANVDGTHRQVASWIWNLLHHIDDNTFGHQYEPQVLNVMVSNFARQHGERMGHVTLREVLRIFAEFMQDPKSRSVIVEKIYPLTKQHPEIRCLPVVLLREQTWPTVRFKEYLSGQAAVRVDPHIYYMMRSDSALALPAYGEGPYHFTDRTRIPWFDVLGINAQL